MNTTLSATEARNRFFEIIDICYYQKIEFTITKNGKPYAKIVPHVKEPHHKKK